MAEAPPELATSHDRRLLALTASICFPGSFALFYMVVPLAASDTSAPAFAVSGFCAALATMLAMALVGSFLARRMQVHNRRMRVALNNMTQALCMFDRNERLVVCNRRYMEFYELTATIAKPGRTLASLWNTGSRQEPSRATPTSTGRNSSRPCGMALRPTPK
jgi:PAS domain-containing protein